MADELEDLPQVGSAIAERLREARFDDYQGIAVASPGELSRAADIEESTAADIVQAARKAADIGGFETDASVPKDPESIDYLETGHDGFDSLLNGGIATESITEVYGNENSGRTAFAHLLAVRAQLPSDHGGFGGQVAYLDTRGRFDPDRITEIIASLSKDDREALANQHDCSGSDLDGLARDVLEHIHVSKPADSTAQILNTEQIQNLAESLTGTEKPLRLVVVDSLTFHFRVEYQDHDELAERQQKLNKHLHDLMRVGDLNNAAVVITNATTNDSKPYGGNILGHTSTYRVQFRKTAGEVRYARLVDAPNVPDGEVEFYFTNGQFTPEPPS